MLSLYNFQGLEGHADGQTNERRIESVQEVTTRATRRVLEGSPVRGAATRLRCAESGFAGRGDVFLFGCVLDELFASFLNVNEVHELGIQLDPSNIELTWLPRSGQQTII
jgi:type VI secretion system protein ImpG